jgi:hypothetical protein
MKKSVLLGLIVAVMAVMTGCDPEAETGGGEPGDEPGAGYAATAEALEEAMAAGKSPIAVVGKFTLGSVTIPANMRVELYSALTLSAGATLAVAGELVVHHAAAVGSLALTAGESGGAKITGTGKVKAGKTEIVGGAAGWQAVGNEGTVTIAVPLETTATITASVVGAVLTAQGAGAAITQLAGADNGLTIAENTVIDLNTGGSLVLTGAASHGAKLAGAGKVVAGGTEITGNASGTWTAGGAAGTVTLAADSITGDAPGLSLTAGGHADAEIKVTGATLTVDGVAVTVVTSYGKVTLVGSSTSDNVGHLLLKGNATVGMAGKLVVSTENTAEVTSTTALTLYPTGSTGNGNASVTGTIPGIKVVAGAADPTTAATLGSIGGGNAAGTTDATINAPSSANNSVFTTASGAKVIAASVP